MEENYSIKVDLLQPPIGIQYIRLTLVGLMKVIFILQNEIRVQTIHLENFFII